MIISTDEITTFAGLIASIAGSLAAAGIATNYSAPIAGVFGSIFAYYTKGITKKS